MGFDEARDKNYLLRELIGAAPDWVLWIDGDEVLERDGPDKNPPGRGWSEGRGHLRTANRLLMEWAGPGAS